RMHRVRRQERSGATRHRCACFSNALQGAPGERERAAAQRVRTPAIRSAPQRTPAIRSAPPSQSRPICHASRRLRRTPGAPDAPRQVTNVSCPVNKAETHPSYPADVRVLLVSPDGKADRPAPGSAADALEELGSTYVAMGLDLEGLDDHAERNPTLIVVDTPDRLATAAGVLRRLRGHPRLLRTPVMLVVSPKQIVELDPEVAPDDVIMAPVHPHELYTRMRLLDFRHASFQHQSRLQRGELVVDFEGYEARLRGRSLQLTRREFELLRFLASHPARAFTREPLLARTWG